MVLKHLNISIRKPIMLRDFPLGKPIMAIFNRAETRKGQEGQRGKVAKNVGGAHQFYCM